MALAGCVIASHYAEPLKRHIVSSAPFRAQPNDDSETLDQLNKGDELRMLDVRSGWAWGYAPDGKVGYVRVDAIAP